MDADAIAAGLRSGYRVALLGWLMAHGYSPCATLGRDEDCERCEQLVKAGAQ